MSGDSEISSIRAALAPPGGARAAYIWRRRTGGTVVESALFATIAACDDVLVASLLANAYAFARATAVAPVAT